VSASPELPAPSDPPSYTEVRPGPGLSPWIECFWSIRALPGSSLHNRVLPDGCSDLIVGVAGSPAATVVGTMRTALVVPLAGPATLFGVRFHPGAALRIFDNPLAELTDQRLPLTCLWGTSADESSQALVEATGPAGTWRAERILAARLGRATRSVQGDEALAERAVALFRRARGGIGVRQAAAALGVGERRLQRAFDRSVGLSPKGLARVLRFRQAVRMLDAAGYDAVSWASLATLAGYADQAHFIREFRALAGITPAAYRRERRTVGFVQYGETRTG
jgi:AraC-like DNA-binding protein